MAAQYSNRHFFRKTPNHYLASFFKAKGIEIDLDFSNLKKTIRKINGPVLFNHNGFCGGKHDKRRKRIL